MTIASLRTVAAGVTAAAALSAFLPATSHAAGTKKLAGSYSGTYSGEAAGFVASGPATVDFKSTSKGKAAKVVIKGVASDGTNFTANVTFKKNGTAHTDALVPGIVAKSGDGSWSISKSGKVLKYDFASNEAIQIQFFFFAPGAITTQGKMKVTGAGAFSINGDAQGQSTLGEITGTYKFVEQS